MADRKTPGVFIGDLPAFPGAIVEVATAIPAFVGPTQTAVDGARSLIHVPFHISSFAEFVAHFGAAPAATFDLAARAGGGWRADSVKPRYYLYDALRLFFANGGGDCFIVSVGNYDAAIAPDALAAGVDALETAPAPAMLVVPDAMGLDTAAHALDLQRKMLAHCSKLQSRVAILDLFGGDKGLKEPLDPSGALTAVEYFRDKIDGVGLDYAAAYYPWIETSLASLDDLSVAHLSDDGLKALLDAMPEAEKPAPGARDRASLTPAHAALLFASPVYKAAMSAVLAELNKQPPSGAIAGVYARTDLTRGVFKAPAGTDLISVVRPLVAIGDDEQQDLNVPLDGKAVNAIRAFPGRGVMVWGARTLNANNQDTRYINVRRTLIMLEQSIKAALQGFMFAPNAAPTWSVVKSEIDAFLLNQWKAGALFGSTPAQAYSVAIGLGASMTGQDILDGRMNVLVNVSLVRPAEFVVLKFQQTMQAA